MFKHEKCRICGEQASGFNYRVVSCNACKGIRSKYLKSCYVWRSILDPLPLNHWEHFIRWTLKIFRIFNLLNMSDLDWPWIRSTSDFIADICQKSSRDWSKMQNKLNLLKFCSRYYLFYLNPKSFLPSSSPFRQAVWMQIQKDFEKIMHD